MATVVVFEYGQYTALSAQDGGEGCVEVKRTIGLLYAGLLVSWACAVAALWCGPPPSRYNMRAAATHSTAEANKGVVM